MQLHIQLTQRATDYINKMLTAQGGCGLRISIKKTGCSGYAYAPAIISEFKQGDFIVQHKEITLAIDPAWAHVMQGLEVDYIEDDKSGLKQKKLVFTNPNETARCGCGESFHIE
jgi:iron-sulfur cluster assembly protein